MGFIRFLFLSLWMCNFSSNICEKAILLPLNCFSSFVEEHQLGAHLCGSSLWLLLRPRGALCLPSTRAYSLDSCGRRARIHTEMGRGASEHNLLFQNCFSYFRSFAIRCKFFKALLSIRCKRKSCWGFKGIMLNLYPYGEDWHLLLCWVFQSMHVECLFLSNNESWRCKDEGSCDVTVVTCEEVPLFQGRPSMPDCQAISLFSSFFKLYSQAYERRFLRVLWFQCLWTVTLWMNSGVKMGLFTL